MPWPSGVSTTWRGPMPMCVKSDAEPGPPLKTKATGRVAGSATPSFVYATKKNVAFGVPASSLMT